MTVEQCLRCKFLELESYKWLSLSGFVVNCNCLKDVYRPPSRNDCIGFKHADGWGVNSSLEEAQE